MQIIIGNTTGVYMYYIYVFILEPSSAYIIVNPISQVVQMWYNKFTNIILLIDLFENMYWEDHDY